MESNETFNVKYFVSLLYISVAIKAGLLKFSMFSVHNNTICINNKGTFLCYNFSFFDQYLHLSV